MNYKTIYQKVIVETIYPKVIVETILPEGYC